MDGRPNDIVGFFRRVFRWATVLRVELAFNTKALRAVCEDVEAAEQELGESAAGRLRRRLADLDVAEGISELVAGNPRVEEVGDKELLTIDIDAETQLRLLANHNPPRLTVDSSVDWDRVTRLKVVSIG